MVTSARELLVDAAGRLFYADGITATGIDAVVRAAGVTKPTLYAHFGAKSELVAAVLRRRYEDRRAELDARLARSTPPSTRRRSSTGSTTSTATVGIAAAAS